MKTTNGFNKSAIQEDSRHVPITDLAGIAVFITRWGYAASLGSKDESNAPTRPVGIEYRERVRPTARPCVDKERICVIRIILRTTGKSTRLSDW